MVKSDCNKNLTFEEKELELLRASVDIAGNKLGAKIKQKNDIDDIIKVLEDFMQRKKVVCYGGTAINNILPANEQFYNKDIEIPDYDFYSPKALKHSRELADLYAKLGYNEIEVRSGVHKETYKLFVDFIIYRVDPATATDGSACGGAPFSKSSSAEITRSMT